MTANKLPPTFCWTKMGTEAGEELTTIIRRKEWERQLSGGYFFWGIGQSLGDNAKVAAPNKTSLRAVFSPMLSKPKAIDITPAKVVLWNAWVDPQGQTHQLPTHYFITSRAFSPSGRKKENHYALVCFSNKKLNLEQEDICIFPKYLRNATTDKPIGASQVTAVVRVAKHANAISDAKGYSVLFTAELRFPYYIRLAYPITLGINDLLEIKEISDKGDLAAWSNLVKCLRSRVTNRIDWVHQYTLDFGETSLFSQAWE